MLLLSLEKYRADIKSAVSDTNLTQAILTSQAIISNKLKYDIAVEWDDTTVPEPIVLCIKLITQSLLSNVGIQGLSQSVNIGGGGSYTVDPSRYYKYFNLIEAYKKPTNLFY